MLSCLLSWSTFSLSADGTTFSVPLRAARQVSADFLTLPDSKLSSRRLVNRCSWKPQQDNTQFRRIEARSHGLLAFFLSFRRSLSFTFIFFPLYKAHFIRQAVGKNTTSLVGAEAILRRFRSGESCLCLFSSQNCGAENLARMARWHWQQWTSDKSCSVFFTATLTHPWLKSFLLLTNI